MAKLTPTQKRNLLSELFYLYDCLGYENRSLIGYPLNHFNYEVIEKLIVELIEEWKVSNNDYEYYHRYMNQI